jgi:hypothetical protein
MGGLRAIRRRQAVLRKIQIFSDGNDDYKTTISKYYAETCVDYGQIIKVRENGKVDKSLLNPSKGMAKFIEAQVHRFR